jgi:hypothetical protein
MMHRSTTRGGDVARRIRCAGQRLLILGAGLAGAATAASAAQLEQTFVLQPGWNAVFLEVAPEADDPESVFQGLPVSSVWRWNPEGLRVDFLRDPADGLESQPGWLGYFPPHRPESVLTNLYGIEANAAYLIKLEGAAPVTWTIRGVPSLIDDAWIADSFNLRGFHVNPGAPPSFGDYFDASAAHAGQPVYRLNPSGVWEAVTAAYSSPIRSGEAYWVFCEGPSDYRGPLEIVNDFGEGIDFGGSLSQSRLVFRNRSAAPATVSVRTATTGTPVPLLYRNVDPVSAEVSWPELPASLTLEIEAGGEAFADFGVQRTELDGRTESMLTVTDSLGTRRRILVGASDAFTAGPAAKGLRSLTAGTAKAGTDRLAGLWVGTVSINGVSESQVGSLQPVPTGSPIEFRVLIHVDSAGQAKLLKEVIQMYEEGTVVPDPDNPGLMTVETPGRYVLLTDDTLIPGFTGADYRSGDPVGLRISTVAYDFPDQFVELTGSFGPGSSLSGSITLDPEFPTNPFRNKYHPDHDNLDEQFLNFREEAFSIVRDMEFDFTTDDPEGKNLKPGWGDSEVGGIFRETISGLHKNDIGVEGVFRLYRVSYTPVLNQ